MHSKHVKVFKKPKRKTHRMTWQEIKMMLKGRWYWKIVRFFRQIKTVCLYLPLLWRDREWDHTYLMKLIEHKLSRMEDFYRHYSVVGDAETIANEIKIARLLIHKGLEEDNWVCCRMALNAIGQQGDKWWD